MFPFLAVLVCAMGALIFLLLITTRRIRNDVLAAAGAEEPVAPLAMVSLPVEPPVPVADPPLPPIPAPSIVVPEVDPHRELETEIERFRAETDRHRKTLLRQRKALAAARQKIRDNQTRQAALRTSIDAANATLASYDKQTQELEHKMDITVEQIAATRTGIRQLREQAACADSRFAFVPFDGMSGTDRRPILIECTKDGFRFVPEDVLITESDMSGFFPDFNPLLAGAAELVRYWTVHDQRSSPANIHADPYVLLLVRPSGSLAYYAAQRMLKHLGTPFGYELIEEDRPVEEPAADPQAVAACRKAVAEAVAARNIVADSIDIARTETGRVIRIGRDGRIQIDDTTNEFGSSVSRPSRPVVGGFSGNALRPGSFGARTNIDPGQFASRARNQEPDPARASGRDSVDLQAERLARANERMSPAAPHDVAAGLPEGLRVADHPTEQFADRTDPTARFNPGNGGFRSGTDSGSDLTDASRSGDFVHPLSEFPDLTRPATRETKRRSLAAGSDADGNGIPDHSQAIDDVGSAVLRPDEAMQRLNDGRQIPRRTPSRRESGHANHGRDQGPLISDSAGGGESNRNSPGGHSDTSQPSLAANDVPLVSSLRIGQSPSRENDASTGEPQTRSWGQVRAGSRIAFERQVTVFIDAERIVVGNDLLVPVDSFRSGQELASRVITEMDRYAHSWGPPPLGLRWVPAVRFLVSPGGNQHLERIRAALNRYGVRSATEFTFEQAPLPDQKQQGDQ